MQSTNPEPALTDNKLTVYDEKADESISDIIEAECKHLSKSTCLSERCFWDTERKKCRRNALTVTTDELNQMVKARIAQMPHVYFKSPHPPQWTRPTTTTQRAIQQKFLLSSRATPQQFQKSHHDDRLLPNEQFVVKEISLDNPMLASLPDSHFLKQRKKQILSKPERKERLDRRKMSLSTYGIGNRHLVPSPYDIFWKDADKYAIAEENEFVDRINKLPIFLHAHEVPVQIVSPERYTERIGTVSFKPDTKTPHMLHLQDEAGKEFSVYIEKSIRMLPSEEEDEEDEEDAYTADAGGRRSRRRTRNVRKHGLRTRKHKQHKQHKHIRRTRSRFPRSVRK